MGSGGGGTSTQYVKSETSNLPAYVQPYFTNLLERGQAQLTTPYQTYGQERIAGFTPEQQQVQQNILGQQTPGQFGAASGLAAASGLGALNQQSFTQPGMAGLYMSPFMQQALEPQMREAIFNAKRGQLAGDLGAARQGTYGGSRQLLASMERERNLGQQLGDIQAKGLQSAYEQAANQFNTEEQRRLAAMQQAGQSAQTLANIGQVQGQTDLARLGQQQQTAAQQQALNQQYLDTAYQDFLRQQNYPMEQLNQYSAILHGIPVSPNTTSTVSAPSPSLASQIMGTGLGALGMYKTLSGG